MKRFLFSLLLVLSLVCPAHATDIAALTGDMGKIGQEDVEWGFGGVTDTYTVTVTGGTTTLTRVPALLPTMASAIKGKYYVSSNALIADHSNAATVGSLAWVCALVGNAAVDIELPGNHTYAIGAAMDMTALAPNARLVFQKGAILSGAFAFKMAKMQAGRYQVFTSTSSPTVTFAYGSIDGMFPEWYGADPTGTVDSGAAFTAAIDAIKRSLVGIGPTGKTAFPLSNCPGGKYISTLGLWLGCDGTTTAGVYMWLGNGSEITFSNAGGAAVDWTGKHAYVMRDILILGDTNTPPAVGILMSRYKHATSAGQAHFEQVYVLGKYTKIGVYNYGSEGMNATNCTFVPDAPVGVAITKSNFGLTGLDPVDIPHQDGSLIDIGTGFYKAQSTIEYTFKRCNIANGRPDGTSAPGTDSALYLEGAAGVLIDHCEIYAEEVYDINLIRLISSFRDVAYYVANFTMRNTTVHPTGPRTGLVPAGSQNYSVGIKCIDGGAGGSAVFRGIRLVDIVWTGANAADFLAQANCKVYNLEISNAAKVDLNAAGCDILENSIIHLPTYTALNGQYFKIDSKLQGKVYLSSGSVCTYDHPELVTAEFRVYDTGELWKGLRRKSQRAVVSTTDATVTTLYASQDMIPGEVQDVVVYVTGKTSAAAKVESYIRRATIRHAGGVAALVGAVPVDTIGADKETDVGADCTIDVTGSKWRIRVTGLVAANIDWYADIEYNNVMP